MNQKRCRPVRGPDFGNIYHLSGMTEEDHAKSQIGLFWEKT
jgi:hypothetical protein